jgi:hypothetical protein
MATKINWNAYNILDTIVEAPSAFKQHEKALEAQQVAA